MFKRFKLDNLGLLFQHCRLVLVYLLYFFSIVVWNWYIYLLSIYKYYIVPIFTEQKKLKLFSGD